MPGTSPLGLFVSDVSDEEEKSLMMMVQKSGKENKCDHKKMKLVAGGIGADAKNRKVETESDSIDSDDDAFSRRDSDAESVAETSCWRVVPTSLAVDAFNDDAKGGDSSRRRFVLKKQTKNK